MATLERIEVLSFARLLAGLIAFVGLITGTLYSVVRAIIGVLVSNGWIGSQSTPGVGWGAPLTLLAIIVMSIMWVTRGFIARAIGVFLYNLVPRRVGGIELHFGQ